MAVTAYAGGGEEWDGLAPVEPLPAETAVSYTHLDVYKRQSPPSQIEYIDTDRRIVDISCRPE